MTTHPLYDNPAVFKMARKACDEATAELDRKPRRLLDPGNPNHPDNFGDKIFGYDREEFIARQYRKKP